MKDEIEELMLSGQKQFDDNEGYVTVEFSCRKKKLNEIEEFIKKNEKSKLGQWIAMECDTCVEYHGEGFVHVSLEKPRMIKEMKSGSNFIRILSK